MSSEEDPSPDRPDLSRILSPHYTREPWWVVPLAGAVTAMLPIWKYASLQSHLPGIGLFQAMLTAGGLGTAAATMLVARSWIRSAILAEFCLWIGILVIALGVCVLSLMLSA
jgi:hypothetical protein